MGYAAVQGYTGRRLGISEAFWSEKRTGRGFGETHGSTL